MAGLDRFSQSRMLATTAPTTPTSVAMMVIDSHSHTWVSPTRCPEYPFHQGVAAEDADPSEFPVSALLAEMGRSGVDRAVLITHDVFQGTDNSYVLDCVAAHPKQLRATAIVDDEAGDVAEQMRSLLRRGATSLRIDPWEKGNAFLAGTRKPTWLLDEMWEEAGCSGQPLSVLIDPADLTAVDAMCARHPNTAVIVDHCARIGVSGTVVPANLNALVALGRHRNTHVKLSAFYAISGFAPPPYDCPGNHVVPMLRRLIEAYGCGRLLWGSDAPYQLPEVVPQVDRQAFGDPSDGGKSSGGPVAVAPHTYAASVDLIRNLGLPDADTAEILGGTARRLFFFDE